MALLDEEIVEYWLNNSGFFCMRGIKTGVGEMDFLALRPNATGFECWHVEVTVSFRPIGYIGGNNNAKRRTADEVTQGIDDWIEKKYTARKKVEKREQILPGAEWRFVLVCAELKHEAELELLLERGIHVIRYKDILSELAAANSQVNSTAGTIVEIIRYMNKD